MNYLDYESNNFFENAKGFKYKFERLMLELLKWILCYTGI